MVKQIDGSSAASAQRGAGKWDSELRASLYSKAGVLGLKGVNFT